MQVSSRLFFKAAIVLLGLVLLLVLFMSSRGGPANAAFYSYRPNLSISGHDAYWGSYADYLARDLTVDLTVSNGPESMADEVTITGATANNGVSLLTSMPVSLGHIMTGESATTTLKFDVPVGVATFHMRITGSAQDESAKTYSYPLDPDTLVYAEGSSGNPRVTVIDTSSMSVVDEFVDYSVPSGNSHRIQVSPDGKYLWRGQNGTTGYVEVLDAATGAQLKRWDVGSHNGPTMGNWTKGGHHYLFFPTGASGGVINIFDVEAQLFVGAIPVGETPNHMWDTTPDGNTLWGTVGSGTTSRAVSYDISNIDTGVIPTVKSAEITIGGSLHALAVDLERPRVYVGSSNGGVNVIDTTTNTVIAWKAGGIGTSHNFTPSPDGQYLMVGESSTYGCTSEVHDWPHDGTRGPFLWALNLDTLTVDMWFETQAFSKAGPSHQTYTSDGNHILMSTTGGMSAVFVLDADTLALESSMSVSGNPHSIGIAGGSGGLGGTTY